MPITRTPIQDDSGSGQDGTVIDNAWKQELYGQIDAFVPAAANAPTTLRYPTSNHYPIGGPGTLHNWAPATGSTFIVWRITATGAVTITGLVPEPDGTMHLLISETGHAITFSNLDAGSAAGGQFIGPGFANFVLGTWRSIWIKYHVAGGAWLLLAP